MLQQTLASLPQLPPPRETKVQSAVLEYLELEPRVAFAFRQNVGKAKRQCGKDRRGNPKFQWISFGFTGCSDILGMLADGRFLALECKSATGRLSNEQAQFLHRVRAQGGVAGVVRSVDDAQEIVGGAMRVVA